MIDKILICRAESFDVYRNQAIEKYLLDTVRQGEFVLYLWANDNAVVIGKNQNAFTECNLDALERDGGKLARRITGGGAVYHDKGNLNFTFITTNEDYDQAAQFDLLIKSVRALGLDGTLSGRNDMLIDGKKFSGNAFYHGLTSSMHHGTVLINTPAQKIADYLNVPKVKLEAKGVKSVVSRVGCLSDFRSGITAEKVSASLITSTLNRFLTAKCEVISENELDSCALKTLTAEFAAREYTLGDNAEYSAQFVRRFDWGTADVRLELSGDIITKARIYSDSLDVEGTVRREKMLCGLNINLHKEGVDDILAAFKEQRDEI